MTRRRWLGWGTAAVVLMAVLVPPVAAQESPLVQVPGKAPIVIQVRGVERTKGRLGAMLRNALPDIGLMVQAGLEAGLQQVLQGRELTGVAPEGPIFVALTELPKQGEKFTNVAVIARVKDYESFRNGFLKEEEREQLKPDPAGYEQTTINDRDVYLINRKNYVVVTFEKDLATELAKPQPQAGLDRKLDKELAKRLLEPDVAVYVDTAAINKEYGNEIQAFRQVMELGFAQAEAGGGPFGGKAQMEMFKKMLDGAMQAFADSQAFVASLEFRPEGLALHLELNIGADTKTNSYLKDLKPAALEDVGKLPTGLLFYMGMEMDPDLAKIMLAIAAGVGEDEDSPQAKAAKEALEQLAEAKPRTVLQAAHMSNQGLRVTLYADPKKATTAQLRLYQSLKEGQQYQSLPVKKVAVKENAQTHRGFQFHYAKLELDLEKFTEGFPEEAKKEIGEVFKKLLGEELSTWFGTDGKVYVEVSAKDWETAQGYLDRYLDGEGTVGKEKAFQEARKHLPAQATSVSLIHAPMYAQVIAEVLYAILKATPFGEMVSKPAKPAKGEPSYIGAAITLRSGQVSMDLWIPGVAAREFWKTFEPMFQDLIKKGEGGF